MNIQTCIICKYTEKGNNLTIILYILYKKHLTNIWRLSSQTPSGVMFNGLNQFKLVFLNK